MGTVSKERIDEMEFRIKSIKRKFTRQMEEAERRLDEIKKDFQKEETKK